MEPRSFIYAIDFLSYVKTSVCSLNRNGVRLSALRGGLIVTSG